MAWRLEKISSPEREWNFCTREEMHEHLRGECCVDCAGVPDDELVTTFCGSEYRIYCSAVDVTDDWTFKKEKHASSRNPDQGERAGGRRP